MNLTAGTNTHEESGQARGSGVARTTRPSMPSMMLRAEGLALLAAALWLYNTGGYSWLALAAMLLAPDLAMLGYLLGGRAGSIAYNLLHTTGLPLLLGLAGQALGQPLWIQLALIWAAHIGMDRTLGFGLKYMGSFKETHLGRV